MTLWNHYSEIQHCRVVRIRIANTYEILHNLIWFCSRFLTTVKIAVTWKTWPLCRKTFEIKLVGKNGKIKVISEAATRGVLCKKVFLEISQNSQERPACNFIKKGTLAQVFSCEFCEISKNTFFTEHLWTTASLI